MKMFAWSACLLLIIGTILLEFGQNNVAVGYVLAVAGSLGILLAPSSVQTLAGNKKIKWQMIGTAVFLLFGLLAALGIIVFGITTPSSLNHKIEIFFLWIGSIVALLITGYLFDVCRGIIFPKLKLRDVGICVLVFLASLATRMAGPNSIAGDEVLHVISLLNIQNGSQYPLFGSLVEDGYPHSVSYVQALLSDVLEPFLTPVEFLKGLSYLCGAGSIALWYVVVRMYAGGLSAACSVLLLLCWGWHWVNSRFIYAYPPDMLIIAAAILFITLAFRTKSALYSALAGVTVSIGFLFQRASLLLPVLFAYLALEALFSISARSRKSVFLVTAICCGTFLIAYEPYLLNYFLNDVSMPLQKRATVVRADALSKVGVSEFGMILHMVVDAFKQFQISVADYPRHTFRFGRPILDPIFSACFTLGTIHCLWFMRRSMTARFCIVGVFLFILPMALGYPVYQPIEEHLELVRGLSRRMLGSSFFVAWIAATGCIALSEKVVGGTRKAIVAKGLCILSAIINIWFYKTNYLRIGGHEWYASRGIQASAMIDLVLQANRSKIRTLVLEGYVASLWGIKDQVVFPEKTSFLKFESLQKLKDSLLKHRGELQLVIIPWDTKAVSRDSIASVKELSDVIPSYLWTAGAVDYDGVPMIRYAYVRP